MTAPGPTLLLTENLPPATGGSGRYLWEIYRRQVEPRVTIVAGDHPAAGEFDRSHAISIARGPLAMSSWGLCNLAGLAGYRRYWRLAKAAVREHGVRRVHCGRCIPEGVIGWLLKKRFGIPYLCFAYGEEMNYVASSRELSWIMRRVVRGADAIVAISRNTQRIAREDWGVPAEKIYLLFPGVDAQRFVPAQRDPAVRARFGWDNRPVILTVGRLQKRKGHDMMIRALAAIRQRAPDVLYAIFGDGEERGALEQLVRDEGQQNHVRFHGELSDADLVPAYQQCDLFVLANRQVGQDIEGFGMVLVEAQACGKPVIAGTSGGTAETMHFPETGRLVNCDGPSELAAAVSELLADPALRERKGQAARAWAAGNFDWDRLAQRAEALFADIAASSSNHRAGHRSPSARSAAPNP